MDKRAAPAAGRILYVDDDPDITEIAAIALRDLGGYEVEVCRSGARALDRVTEFGPDLVILDINMPGLDGPATLERLRAGEANSEVPVVFVSGDARARAIAGRAGSGVLGLIEKPFDPLKLPDLVNGLWRRQGGREEQELAAKLEALRVRFRERLPGRLAELQRAWSNAVEAGFDSASMECLHRTAHNLAGAAGAHGMDELGARLGEATRLLRSWQEAARPPGAQERARVEAMIRAPHDPG